MAYINKHLSTDEKWYGPLPNKAGEFCGNSMMEDLRVTLDGVVTEMRISSEWQIIGSRRNVRIGRPSNCKAGTSNEMAQKGYVGLYMINDATITAGHENSREIDTDVLQEEVVSGQREPLKPFVPDVPMREY